jgi:16S rRNA (cytosine967-C5)-methyltransferase
VNPTAARSAAYEVLRRVFEHDAWADRALPAALERHAVSERDRGLAQRLAYGAVQRRGTSDALAEGLAGRPVTELDAPVMAALRLGLYELLFNAAVADYAAVDQAVELAKRSPRGGRGAGLVNAVLRRAARERASLLAGLRDDDAASAAVKHSHPLWLVEKWWSELGRERTLALLSADNQPSETALRVNTLRGARGDVAERLAQAGAHVGPAGGPAPLDVPELLVVEGRLGEAPGPLIADGSLLPQSRASAAVVATLDPRSGERVLDLCAGPGVKTTQIAARMGNRGEIIAIEIDSGRASQLAELAERTGSRVVHVIEEDAASPAIADLGAGYDRVLVDPPCSDLGTLASRPDARWRKSSALIERVSELQRRLLERAAGAVRPGGTLVYSVCTISVPEGEQQVARLLEGPAGAGLEADDLGQLHPRLASRLDPRFLQTLPDRDGTDGFFIARFRKTEAT